MIVIGLTGNIACGKSAVARMLSDLGAEVFDLDKVAHELMLPGTDVYRSVVEEFGRDILSDSGGIDRARLGSIVFSDPRALARLDQIVHPAVLQRMDDLIASSTAKVVVIEAIKLIESEYHYKCDVLWVVACTKEQQLDRLQKERHLTRDEATARIEAQGPQAEKMLLADVVIDNSGTLEHTRKQVLASWRKLVG